MTDRARREYAEALRPRYARADRRECGRILDKGHRVVHEVLVIMTPAGASTSTNCACRLIVNARIG